MLHHLLAVPCYGIEWLAREQRPFVQLARKQSCPYVQLARKLSCPCVQLARKLSCLVVQLRDRVFACACARACARVPVRRLLQSSSLLGLLVALAEGVVEVVQV